LTITLVYAFQFLNYPTIIRMCVLSVCFWSFCHVSFVQNYDDIYKKLSGFYLFVSLELNYIQIKVTDLLEL